MSARELALQNHGVHQSIREFQNLLPKESDVPDEETYEKIRHIRSVVNTLAAALRGVDPDLINFQALNSIKSGIDRAIQNVRNYASNKNSREIFAASDNIDSILPDISRILSIINKGVSDEIIKLVKDDANEIIKDLKLKYNDLSENIKSLEESVDEIYNKLNEINDLVNEEKDKIRIEIEEIKKEYIEKISNILKQAKKEKMKWMIFIV